MPRPRAVIVGIAGALIVCHGTGASPRTSLGEHRLGYANRLFVLDAGSKSVGTIDLATGKIGRAAFTPAGDKTEQLEKHTPAEMLMTADGSTVAVLDHGPGKRTSEGWRPVRRSRLALIDAASLQARAFATAVWGMPVLRHVSSDRKQLTVVGPGYRSDRADEMRPPELVTVDVRTGETIARFDLTAVGGTAIRAEDWFSFAALSADGRYLYLLDRGDPSGNRISHVNGSIRVVDTATGQLRATLPAGSDPRALTTNADGTHILVLSDHPPYLAGEERTGELRVIRGDSIVATIPIVRDPQFVRSAADGERYFVFSPTGVTTIDAIALQALGQTTVERAGPGLRAIPVVDWLLDSHAGTIDDAAISPDRTRAYLLHADSSQVSILDLTEHRRIATVTTGRASRKVMRVAAAAFKTYQSVLFAQQAARLLGLDFYVGWVHRVLPARTQLVVSGDGRYVYVLNSQTNDVSVVDSGAARVIAHVPAPGNYVALLPGGEYAYVGGVAALTFIDTRTHKEAEDREVRGHHTATAMSPDGRYLVVLSKGLVSCVDTHTGRLAASFGEFKYPTQVLFDPAAASPERKTR